MTTRCVPVFVVLGLGLLGTACGDSTSSTSNGGDDTSSATSDDTTVSPETGDASGDGDGDPSGDGDGDASGDGDPSGDGDGDPSGDGDGDPSGDGDGDPSGDGDGDPSGDGDGDGDGDPNTCGNGVVDPGEDCDDPVAILNGECTDACKFPPSPCGTQAYEATLELSPVDIIVAIDNSGSMGNEIVGVQNNINVNFAQIIEDAGLDYRVIMVTRHGRADPDESVCIEAPLSGIPQGGCANPPAAPVNNPPFFFHYNVEVGSHNAWCKLLDGYTDADLLGQQGWGQWLREDALKSFIVLSDDGVTCTGFDDNDNVNDGTSSAASFDAALLGLDPVMFGTADARRYNFFSIVGMAYNNPPTDPYLPADPVITGQCPTAADPGTGHQALSVLTSGLRFPLCDTTSYDVVFQGIAESVIAGSPVSCELPLPIAPDDQLVNLASLVVEYTPGGMGAPIVLTKVPDLQSCAPNSFYIEGETIYLCPETCDLVQGDFDAEIDMEYLCVEPG